MEEMVMRNADLGIQVTKVTYQGEGMVLADNIRDALKWDTVPHMIRGLKPVKEFAKVSLSALKANGIDFAKFGKVKQNTLYVYFLTKQGVTKLIATRRPHDVKKDPALAQWLDKLQDWIYGEVLPDVLATGKYVSNPVACQHAISGAPKNMAESLRMLADEYEAHELTIGVLNDTKAERDDALETVKEQKEQIDWIDSQRMDMADSVARFSPIGEQPEDSIPVRGIFRRKTKKAEGEFDKPQNSHYSSMIRRAISRLVMYDYELEEFRTVMKADEIKGTKHTKDECVLLELYNAGKIQIATTLIGE